MCCESGQGAFFWGNRFLAIESTAGPVTTRISHVREAPSALADAPKPTGHVLLMCVGERIQELLNATLGEQLVLDSVTSHEQFFEEADHVSLQVDMVVIGVEIREPVRVAQRVRALGLNVPVLILSEPDQYEQLSQALKFAPFLGPHVSPLSVGKIKDLPDAVTESVSRAQKQRAYKGSLKEAQKLLGSIHRERPQATQYMERLLDRAPVGVVNVDVRGAVLTLNRYAGHVLRTTERDSLGSNFTEFFLPDERVRLAHIIARCVAPARKPSPETFTVDRADGSICFVEIMASAFVDRAGQLGSTLILHDVTDRTQAERLRKKAEEALRASERRYRELVQTMNEALALTDEHYHITYVNRSFCEMFECVEEDVIGIPLLSLVHDDDKSMMQSRMGSKGSEGVRRYVTAWKTRTGKKIHTLTSPKSVYDQQDNFVGCLGVFTDISDRIQAEQHLKESESQLRLVTDAIPVIIIHLDHRKRFRFCNRTFEDWNGISRQDVVGRHARGLLGDAAYNAISKCIDTALLGERVECEFEMEFPNKGALYVRGNLVPDLDERGDVQGVVAVLSDTTARKQADERERQHMLELAHVSRVTTIGEMSSQIAHELAQPLTAIGGMSVALRKLAGRADHSKEDLLETLEEISVQAERAREIVTRLRNFVRNAEISRVELDVNELIRGVLRLLQVDSNRQKLPVDQRLQDPLARVQGDRVLLEQVFVNLIRNALDAMKAVAEDRRQLEIVTSSTNKDHVTIRVADAGPGLPPEIMHRIFEPFFTTKSEGMGMGLAITRSVVVAHGGTLQATANEFGGATFSVTLPVVFEEHD